MASEEEQEHFHVAADFTLYSNPLVRALHRPASDNKIEDSARNPEPTEPATEKEDEWIASDMTAYDSPMSNFDKRTVMRENKEFNDMDKLATVHTTSSERKSSNDVGPKTTTSDSSHDAMTANLKNISIKSEKSNSNSGLTTSKSHSQKNTTAAGLFSDGKAGNTSKGVKSVMANPSTGVKIKLGDGQMPSKVSGSKENKTNSSKDTNSPAVGTGLPPVTKKTSDSAHT